MEIIGELNNTDLTIEIDLHDLKNEMDLADLIEEGCRDYIDNIDFDERVNIENKALDLLDQYDGMTNPCHLGIAFEKAVWWAMSRSDKDTPTPSEEGVTLHEKYQEEIKRLVREEVRTILNMTVGRLEVQAKYSKVDDDPSLT